MAMYEDKGFCPSNEFTLFAMEESERLSPNWEEAKEILGSRIGYMVYAHNGRTFEYWSYIVDAIEGATGTLGIEIAKTLKEMIPNCVYAKEGRPIICKDYFRLSKATEVTAGNRKVDSPFKTVLHEDERYWVVIEDREMTVHIYLAKK